MFENKEKQKRIFTKIHVLALSKAKSPISKQEILCNNFESEYENPSIFRESLGIYRSEKKVDETIDNLIDKNYLIRTSKRPKKVSISDNGVDLLDNYIKAINERRRNLLAKVIDEHKRMTQTIAFLEDADLWYQEEEYDKDVKDAINAMIEEEGKSYEEATDIVPGKLLHIARISYEHVRSFVELQSENHQEKTLFSTVSSGIDDQEFEEIHEISEWDLGFSDVINFEDAQAVKLDRGVISDLLKPGSLEKLETADDLINNLKDEKKREVEKYWSKGNYEEEN